MHGIAVNLMRSMTLSRRMLSGIAKLRLVCKLEVSIRSASVFGGACNVLYLTGTPAGATLRIDLYEPEPKRLWHDAPPRICSRSLASLIFAVV